MSEQDLRYATESETAIKEGMSAISSRLRDRGSSAALNSALETSGALVQALARAKTAMAGGANIEGAIGELSEAQAAAKTSLAEVSLIFDNDEQVAELIRRDLGAVSGKGDEFGPIDPTVVSDWELAMSIGGPV